jgi:drug/metabolite transporter (DMT)-like permease
MTWLRRMQTRRRIWLIGRALVIAGLACFFLSDLVTRQGSWWQGTLDAFGDGFLIGGIVAAVSMNLLTKFMSGSDRQREE